MAKEKFVYIVFYGRKDCENDRQVFIDNKFVCTTKRKCKKYKSWSGVFAFLLKATYDIPLEIIQCRVDEIDYPSTAIGVFFRPIQYMNFNDLAQIAYIAGGLDYC